MKRKLDVNTWARKAHFEFFGAFEEPFYGVCVNVDCTAAYENSKRVGASFFLYYLHRSLAAAQSVECFRYRKEEGEVFVYDQVDAGAAIDRVDGTFGYGLLVYRENFEEFVEGAAAVIEQIRHSTGLPRTTAKNIIRYSTVPWLNFTSLSHARMFSLDDSCPKITFGKMTESGGRRSMPVSIHVHHALVDGRDVGAYVDCFQGLMDAG